MFNKTKKMEDLMQKISEQLDRIENKVDLAQNKAKEIDDNKTVHIKDPNLFIHEQKGRSSSTRRVTVDIMWLDNNNQVLHFESINRAEKALNTSLDKIGHRFRGDTKNTPFQGICQGRPGIFKLLTTKESNIDLP